MDKKTFDILRRLNNDFYAANYQSFSSSRKTAWPGWNRVMTSFFDMPWLIEQNQNWLEISTSIDCEGVTETTEQTRQGQIVSEANVSIDADGVAMQMSQDQIKTFKVLDVASGNFRFERFLLDKWPDRNWAFTALDHCDNLAVLSSDALSLKLDEALDYKSIDILKALGNKSLQKNIEFEEPFDLTVAFGFMHHIPGTDLRERFISELLNFTSSQGIAAFSFWRFAEDDTLAQKAKESTDRAQKNLSLQLETNDYLLGWDGKENHLRYCHSFTDKEIDEIVNAMKDRAFLVDRFLSDGRNNALNAYLVFQPK